MSFFAGALASPVRCGVTPEFLAAHECGRRVEVAGHDGAGQAVRLHAAQHRLHGLGVLVVERGTQRAAAQHAERVGGLLADRLRIERRQAHARREDLGQRQCIAELVGEVLAVAGLGAALVGTSVAATITVTGEHVVVIVAEAVIVAGRRATGFELRDTLGQGRDLAVDALDRCEHLGERIVGTAAFVARCAGRRFRLGRARHVDVDLRLAVAGLVALVAGHLGCCLLESLGVARHECLAQRVDELRALLRCHAGISCRE